MATLRLSSGLTMACSSVFIPISTILMGLRFYTRHVKKTSIGKDDWVMLAAYVFLIGMQVTMIVETCKKMIGYPDPDFKPGFVNARTNLAFWPFELLQVPALGLVKLSVVFFYQRVFSISRKTWQFWTTLVTLVIITAWTVAFFFSFLFICKGNPSNYWKSAKDEKAYCVHTQKLHLSFAVSDTILDILVMAIVIPMIWNLQLSMSRKFAVTAIFGLGVITVAASLTRMAVFVQATALRYDPYLDFEYLDTSAMYWSMLETGLGFITANLIIVYSLITHYRVSSFFRRLSSSMFSRLNDNSQSQIEEKDDSPFQNEKGHPPRTYTTESAHDESFTASDLEDLRSDDENIYVRKEYGTTLVAHEQH